MLQKMVMGAETPCLHANDGKRQYKWIMSLVAASHLTMNKTQHRDLIPLNESLESHSRFSQYYSLRQLILCEIGFSKWRGDWYWIFIYFISFYLLHAGGLTRSHHNTEKQKVLMGSLLHNHFSLTHGPHCVNDSKYRHIQKTDISKCENNWNAANKTRAGEDGRMLKRKSREKQPSSFRTTRRYLYGTCFILIKSHSRFT